METMGLKFTPVIVRCLLGPLSVFGPMVGTSCTHSHSKQLNRGFNPPPTALPTSPHPTHLLLRAICDITVVVTKLLKIQQS